jgi:hypothetical protein
MLIIARSGKLVSNLRINHNAILNAMSIFSTPVSRLTTADLQELLDEHGVENARLEFKSLIPGKDDTLKKLSSFANTYGGFMVVGAGAESADGRIKDLNGVDVEAGYKQKVVQWCFDGVSPPLVVEVSDAIPSPSGNGKVCYVINVEESDVAPHFLNGRKGVWVRTDEFSARFEACLANDNELRHLLDRRRLVREHRERLLSRARVRFDTHMGRVHATSGGGRTKLGPTLELGIIRRFPARPLCEEAALERYIVSNRMSWRMVSFPNPASPMLSQHESAIFVNAARSRTASIFEANVWGGLLYGVEMDTEHGETRGILLGQFIGCVLLFTHHAGKMLTEFGHSGPLLIDLRLNHILGIPWLTSEYGSLLFPQGDSELDDRVATTIETTVEAILKEPDRVAKELLQILLFSVNLHNFVKTAEKIEDLVRLGYEYNHWGKPTA